MTRSILICLMGTAFAGCASDAPELTGGSFPERARQLLAEQAELGPVAFVSRLKEPDPASLAFAAEEGVRGLEVSFDPALPEASRFRLVVTRDASDPCGGSLGQGLSTVVAFCRDGDAVASSIGIEGAIETDTVRRASRQIFPDDYGRNGGVGIFGGLGRGVSVGIGGSIGF